jgi:hypothetical protein
VYLLLSLLSLLMAIELFIFISLLSLLMAIELFIFIIIIMLTAMFYHSGLFPDHLNIVSSGFNYG